MVFPLLLMAYIWEILGLYNDYSLVTPLYNSMTYRQFQQLFNKLFNDQSMDIITSYCCAFQGIFQISTPPCHVKTHA